MLAQLLQPLPAPPPPRHALLLTPPWSVLSYSQVFDLLGMGTALPAAPAAARAPAAAAAPASLLPADLLGGGGAARPVSSGPSLVRPKEVY